MFRLLIPRFLLDPYYYLVPLHIQTLYTLTSWKLEMNSSVCNQCVPNCIIFLIFIPKKKKTLVCVEP